MTGLTWAQALDLVAAVLLLAGGALALGAAIGVLRFPDMVTRMHAGAKPLTLGLILAVFGLALTLREPSALGLLALVVVLQVLTVPVSAHMVARVAYRSLVIDTDTLVVDELAEDLTRAGYGRGTKLEPGSPDPDSDSNTDSDSDSDTGSVGDAQPPVDEPVVPGATDDALGEQVAGVDHDDRQRDVDQEGQ